MSESPGIEMYRGTIVDIGQNLSGVANIGSNIETGFVMPVSGLVVSFSDQTDLREQAIAAISRESRMEPGVLESNRMAVVVDTMTAEEDKQLWNWLTSLSGVAFVDVVMVGFEDRVESPNEYFSEHSQGTVDHGS